jgi:hypothetical protein
MRCLLCLLAVLASAAAVSKAAFYYATNCSAASVSAPAFQTAATGKSLLPFPVVVRGFYVTASSKREDNGPRDIVLVDGTICASNGGSVRRRPPRPHRPLPARRPKLVECGHVSHVTVALAARIDRRRQQQIDSLKASNPHVSAVPNDPFSWDIGLLLQQEKVVVRVRT